MTLKHLRIFTEVCRLESITKASESLNMAQPAVSCAIKELESYYGVNLFERMNRRIYLTEVGQCLLSYANTILTQFDEAKENIQNTARTSRIRLGSNVAFGTAWLPDYLSSFHQNHPDIHVYTIIHNSSHIEDLLLRNELDFAIVDNLSTSPYFHSQLIQSETMTAVCSPYSSYNPYNPINPNIPYASTTPSSIRSTLPINPATPATQLPLSSLQTLPILIREKGSGSRECIEQAFRSHGLTLRPHMESISTQALIEACIRGLGILFISKILVKQPLKTGLLIELPIENATFSRNYSLIYHKSKFITNSMHLFIQMLTSNCIA